MNYVCNRCCLKESRTVKPLETPFYGTARLKRVFFYYLEATDKTLLLLLNLILNSAQTLAGIVS